MTHGFLDYYSSKKTRVWSAGIDPLPIHAMALKVMDSVGIPLETIEVNFNDVKEKSFTYIITFSQKAHQLATVTFKQAKIFHIEMDSLDSTTGSDKRVKTAFKEKRKELQEYCINFVETVLEKKPKNI